MATETSGAMTPDTLSASQRDRRSRMLTAARQLAAKGGYDGVQMRDVADRAEVALGTLYRYFPSKVHLLVAVMNESAEGLADRMERGPIPGDTAADRVIHVLGQAIRGLQREPLLSEAMTRALMFADTSAATDVHSVTVHMTGMIIRAMRGPDREPSDDDEAIARVLEQVWLSTLTAWLAGRASASQLSEDIEVAARLLLR